MRNRFLAAALCIVALVGCDNGFTPQDGKLVALKGTVRVVVDDGQSTQRNARTAVPVNPGFAYTLTFTAPDKDVVTADLIGNTGEVQLDAGNWTLNVSGTKSSDTVAESGAIPVTMDGEPVTINVSMRPVLNGAAGSFRYNIVVAQGLTDVSASLNALDIGDANPPETALPIPSGWQTISLAPGYYWFTAIAGKGGQRVIRREVVHIYSYTETVKIYDLTEEDFAPAVYLAGTLTGSIDGYSPTAVLAYEDAECQTDSGSGAVQGDAWSLKAEGTPETVYFKVKLTKDGADAYYSKPVAVSDIPAIGKTDITLPVEAYTVTFDAKGGTIVGGGDRVIVAAPENGTLVPPGVSHSTCVFNGWVIAAGGAFTEETCITGDTTVYAAWRVNGEALQTELASAVGGDTVDTPAQLDLSVTLSALDWEAILAAILGAGKYVALDLSACVMPETEFDPRVGTGGADKIVSLVLPDAAVSIPAGDFSNATFKDFTNLASLSGAGIESVGSSAFVGCLNLESVSLPAATSIGENAFYGCMSLESVDLPLAETISGGAFNGCTSLESVDLPLAETISGGAFLKCTSLESVSLPATPPSIGSNIFSYIDSTGTITVSVPTGAVSAYTSDWGVDASTAANGNTDVYGENHKAVLITD